MSRINFAKFSGDRHSERAILRLLEMRDTKVASFCGVIHVDLEREWAVTWTSLCQCLVSNGIGHHIVTT